MSDQLILQRMDRQDAKLDKLTDSLTELTKILAKKEANDHHLQENVNALSSKVSAIEADIDSLKVVDAGNKARQELINWIVKPALGAIGLAAVYIIAQAVQR